MYHVNILLPSLILSSVKLRVRSKCHQFVAFEEEEETKEMDTTQESVNGTVEVDPVAAISPPMDYSLPTGMSHTHTYTHTHTHTHTHTLTHL